MHIAELKKGTAPFMILALLDVERRHGYELSKLIEARSKGVIRINAASLYPLLSRMEEAGWIRGRWVEAKGMRRRRYYELTATGREVLSEQRQGWTEFVEAMSAIAGVKHA